MSELKLKIFIVLDGILKDDLADNRAYDCLKVICRASIDALNAQISDGSKQFNVGGR